MSFEVGRLSAALTLDGVDQFNRDVDGVGRRLRDAGQQGASFGSVVASGVRTAAGATTGLVAAAGAYLAILAKTGVAYNSMQQNSRAALTVLLGGTQQANAQMAKLDDFAKNSPFSKSVFIQAQQQLIGFGMEAAKVVPTLDAIQQGVAAMGGSNEQISEVVNILAKVQSTGKFTAETLNELGYRGIDAATLMGAAMGKTAAQMREDISAGAIGGAEAIDVLVDAMQNRFGGAADGVKRQWTGAVDRVKAASRDIGAHIAEPFVSAEGGGMAVTWGNQVANVLRAIEKQAVPVMSILTQRGMPFFASFTQSLDAAQGAIQRWDPSKLDEGLNRLAGHAPGIAAVTGAVLALGAQVGPLGKLFSALNIGVNPVLAAFVGLAAASPEVRASLKGLLDAGKPLIPVVGELATILSNTLNSALPVVAGGIDVLSGALKIVVGLFEAIPTPVLVGAAAFLALHKASSTLEKPLGLVSDMIKRFGEHAAVQAHLGETSRGMGMLAYTSMNAQGAVRGLGTALKTAFLANPIGIALTAVTAVIGLWAAANANAQQKVEDHRARVAALRETLDQTTGAITEATRASIEQNMATGDTPDLLARIGVSSLEAAEAVREGGAALDELMDKISEVSGVDMRGGDSYIFSVTEREKLLGALQAERDALVASQQAQRDHTQAQREHAAAMTDGARSNERFNDALAVARDTTKDAETRVRALKQALDELKGGAISAEEAQIRLTRTVESLAEGLSRTDEAGNRLWQSTLDAAGAIDVSTGAGADFAEMMQRASREMLQGSMSASDFAMKNGDVAGAVQAATAAGNDYIVRMQETMREQGLLEPQIEALTQAYLDVPSVVSTLLTDNNTISEVEQRLLELAMQIDQTPDKTVVIDEPESPEILKRLQDLNFAVTHLEDGKVQVTALGTDTVENTLNYLARPRTVYMSVASDTAALLRHQGGLDTAQGQHFAQGGMPSGIYRGVMGGIPKMGVDGRLHIFGEKELGVDWETYISPKASRARNAMLLMETARRIGFPIVPASALRGVRGFDQGGTVGRALIPSYSDPGYGGPQTVFNVTNYNPVSKSPADEIEEARELDAAEMRG